MMSSLPQWYRDEREKLRGYTLRDRLKYIWLYYKLWIIGIGFVLGNLHSVSTFVPRELLRSATELVAAFCT